MELGRLAKDHSIDAQPTLDSAHPFPGEDPPTSPSVSSSTSLHDELESVSDHSEAPQRHRNVFVRLLSYLKHGLDLVCSERINCLLVFVPIGITVGFLDIDPILDFILNALAIIPLAVVISTATENLASRLGDTFGALLNVTVGNAAELMIFFVALAKNQIRIVQASLLGSVLTNLLLILGTALVTGGLRFRDHLRDRPAVRLSVALLDIGLVISVYPIAFWAATTEKDPADIKQRVLDISRGTSFGLVFLYLLYLTFQMGSEATSKPDSQKTSFVQEAVPLSTMRSTIPRGRANDSSPVDYMPRQANLGKLRSGMSRSRWLRWVSAITGRQSREQYPAADRNNDASHSLLRRDAASDGSDAEGEDEESVEDDDDQPKQSTRPNTTSGASDSIDQEPRSARQQRLWPERNRPRSSASPTEAVRAANALSSALPPSPPSTIPSLPDEEPDPPRGRSLLSVPYITSNAVRGASGSIDWAATASRNGVDLTLVRRSTLKDLYEHRRSRSRQSRTPLAVSLVVLALSAAFASVCSEFAVGAIPPLVESAKISQIFIGFIILPVVGNAAEHVTAAKLAMHNKFVLAKSVAIESSTQVVLLITPAMILLGWARDRELSLQFDIYEIASVVVASVMASFVVSCGKGHWTQGVLLYTVFAIIAAGAFFYPTTSQLYGGQ